MVIISGILNLQVMAMYLACQLEVQTKNLKIMSLIKTNIIKGDLEARPVYVSTKEHIEAHFLTCFVALVIVRILKMKLNHKYSIGNT